MDTRIHTPFWRKREVIWGVSILSAVVLIGLTLTLIYQGRQVPRLTNADYQVGNVERSIFEDQIATRGQAVSGKSTLIDANTSGTVIALHVSNGTVVEAGDPILTLGNPAIELQLVSDRERVEDRLDALQSREVELQRVVLDRERELGALEFDVIKAARDTDQIKQLLEGGLISEVALRESEEVLDFQKSRLAFARRALEIDRTVLKDHKQRIINGRREAVEQNKLIEQRLERLSVKANGKGVVTGLDLSIGQQISEGARIAELGDLSSFEVIASIDEFYLGQVTDGISGWIEFADQSIPIEVRTVTPNVVEGKFEATLSFINGAPQNLRQGQTVPITLEVSRTQDVLVMSREDYDALPDRQFLYVISTDGQTASRRRVSFGRKSRTQVEILNGLTTQTRFLSSYPPRFSNEQLRLN